MKTPIDIIVHLSNDKGKRINLLKYSWIIESLMYVINYIRLDITYSITKLNGFTSNQSINHWKVINKVLRYSRYSLNYELHYIGYLVVLWGCGDVNLISNTKDFKSTSGYVFTLDETVMSLKSPKKSCIVRSTMDSNFIAFNKFREEIEWLYNFLEDILC